MPYIPPKKILEKYADVLVNFALGKTKGIKKGDVVRIYGCECAKPFIHEVYKAVLRAGGHPMLAYSPDDDHNFSFSKEFFFNADNHQITFFPSKFIKGVYDQIDHILSIHADTDPHSLKGVDPKKMMGRAKAFKKSKEWKNKKEDAGKLTWTMANYGTKAMAKEAKLSEKEYWNQIIKACFLDKKNPIAEWKQVYGKMESYRKKLNILSKKIDKIHIKSEDADIWFTLGEKRAWRGGEGCNIPSFELFTSPDLRGTNGWMKFNQPLYRYGNLITGIELEFKNGKVVKSKAKKGQKILREMIATKGADMVGEISLTDKRFSRITKFMADSMYDENVGGSNGNFHLALGSSFHDCYSGNLAKTKKSEWKKLGYNESVIHTDIISTAPRVATAHLKNGSKKVIYKNGMFVL